MSDGSLDFCQRKNVLHQLCYFGACEIFDLRGKALNRAAQITKAVGVLGAFAFLQILPFDSPDTPACAVPVQAASRLVTFRFGAGREFSVLSLRLTSFFDFGDKKRPLTLCAHGAGQRSDFRYLVFVFSSTNRKVSACISTRDRRANVARGAAPCSERSDAKQPGLSIVRAVSSAGRTYSRQESIEVRPLFQRDSSGSRSLNAFFKCFCALILLFYLILRLFEHDAVSLRDFQ